MALVTGAGRGLGRAISVAFAKQGHAVVVNYHQRESDAMETAQAVKAAGSKALVIQADVRNSSSVNAMMDRVSTEWGRLDVLVNNAGSVRNNLVRNTTDEDWAEVIATNLNGTFYCTRAAISLLRERKGAAIINLVSFLAVRGGQGAANYAAAKAGVIALTKTTALEEGGCGIRVNAVLPGFHVTDMNRDVWNRYEKRIRDQHILKEMPAREELGEFVVSIARLSTVTGQVFSFESRIL